jgi:peptidoglycan hydrolase-like protein with peptidoglycan-binding domain
MRTALAATALMLVAHAAAAQAVATPSAAPDAKPRPATPAPVRPTAAAAPADAAALAERTAIQSDLAWVGLYNGAINGEAGERYTNAIRTFQKNNKGAPSGTLTAQERALLAGAAKVPQAEVGWKIVTDPATGARLGLPGKLVTQQSTDPNGSRWTSPTGIVQVILTRRKETAGTAKLAEQERKDPAGRRIDYSAVKPDFFVVSGMQGLKKFYVRGQAKDGELRLLTILYDQALDGTMEPVTVAMSSAFVAFPSGTQAAAAAPRRSVEYATGFVVNADGAIVTDRLATDGCLSLVVAGYGHADRVAEEKSRDLALLRIYGARDLKPLGLGGGVPKPGLDITGIADPQSQAGGRAASVTKASLGPAGDLAPAPGLGFSGAPARDDSGSFAGVALLKPALVAGPAPPNAGAALVPADAVRSFLRGRNVAFSESAGSDATASVVRVICVRK